MSPSRLKSLRKDCQARWAATQGIAAVMGASGRAPKSLEDIWPGLIEPLSPKDRNFAYLLCYGSLRWWLNLKARVDTFLTKPIKPKDRLIEVILVIGAFQLEHLNTPKHAAVSTSATLARLAKGPWAASLVNGVLRSMTRQTTTQPPSTPALTPETAYPTWIIERLAEDWPVHIKPILNASIEQGPLCLRVNTLKGTRAAYLQTHGHTLSLTSSQDAPTGLYVNENRFSPRDLPGFEAGFVTVQDESAQLAVHVLVTQAKEKALHGRALDACAAPGGKTMHWLEQRLAAQDTTQAPGLVALDASSERMPRIQENYRRLFQAQPDQAGLRCVTGDAGQPSMWWNGDSFDAILVDAPCSGSGVMRRHPDIKWLRRDQDIAQLTTQQLRILHGAWSTLKPEGYLLYTTCSVFRDENDRLIAAFLSNHKDAQETTIEQSWGIRLPHGIQRLPEKDGGDGFYYCLLKKT